MLTQASYKLAEHMYRAAQPQGGPTSGAGAGPGAAPPPGGDGQARTDEGVNLSDQVFWQQDVCAYYIHTSSVTPTCDLVNCPAIRSSKKRALSARFNVFGER